MYRHILITLTFCALAVLAPRTAQAENTELNATDLLLQQELRQSQIRDTTARVGAQLDVIIDEYERNGLAGDDVAVLKAIRSVLGDLTQDEIKKVIALLQSARNTSEPGKSSENTLNAYAGQKTIIVQLRHLLLEYQRQQILREIARRFRDLGRRQGANMAETIALFGATGGRDARRSKESHRISLQLQSTEQVTIKDETIIVLDKLYDVVSEMDGLPAEKPRMAVARAREGELELIVTSAADDLKASNLKSAAGNEKRARDLFVELARLLRPDRDTMTILKEALRDLQKTMAKQEALIDETKKATEKKLETDDRNAIEKGQMKVVDETDVIREDLAEHAPIAASALNESIDRQQQARAELRNAPTTRRRSNNEEESPVVEKQREALTKMHEARVILAKKIEEAQKAGEEAEDKISKLKKLLAEVQELSQKQADAKAVAALVPKDKKDLLPQHAAQQQTLKALAQDAHAKSIPLAKEAANSLAEAAKQMGKAAESLANKLPAPRTQQAAADALKRAESELSQEVAKLEKAEEQLAKLDKLGEKVTELLQEQFKVQLQTAKAAEARSPEGERQARAQAPRQNNLADETSKTASEATQTVPQASRNLASASNDMAEAAKELKKPDANAARQEQGRAIENLLTAKQEIDRKKEEIAKALGKPEESKPDMLAEATEQVAAAQLLVNKAVSELDAPATLEALVKDEQGKLAAKVDKKAKAEPDSPVLLDASKAARKAADELGAKDVPSAIGEMAKAEDNLKKAAQSESAKKPDSKGENNQGDNPQGESEKGDSNKGAKPNSGQGKSNSKPADAAQLAKEQGDLRAIAQQLAQAKPELAAEPLDDANKLLSPLTSGAISMLPMDAQLALRAAQRALTEASAQATSGDASPAQQNAQQAQSSLNKAAAALALAQKGLGNNAEQQMAQGEGGRGESEQKGKGNAKGPGKNKAQEDSKDGQGNGDKGNFNGKGGTDGRLRRVADRNTFIGLPARERNAILQSLGESYPEEFGPLVEQYLKNLSDQASRGTR